MRAIIIILALKLCLFISCMPPEMKSSGTHTVFANGIHLENIGVTIPWEVNFSEISKYGNPKIIAVSRKLNHIKWDSVTVLGVNANLTVYQNKRTLSNKLVQRLSTVYGKIGADDIENLKTYFEAYTQKPGRITRQKDNMYYYWLIDGCNVRLGNGERYGNYLWVQKIYKR